MPSGRRSARRRTRLGGLGAYESVTVRGASAGNTEVLIDGVPLSRIAAVTTDLGRFALDAFGQVELYRGAVPVELGGAGVGGRAESDHAPRTWRARRADHRVARLRQLRRASPARALWRSLRPAVDVRRRSAIKARPGDFTYFNDNGTPLEPKDDSFKTRTNNGFDQVDLASRVGLVDSQTAGGLRVAYKSQGLAGTTEDPTTKASLATLDVVGDGKGDLRVGPATAREAGYVLVERQHLRDPLGELGLGAQARDYTTISGGATSTWHLPIDRHRATAGVELHADHFTDSDETGARPSASGNRESGAIVAALDLVLDPDGVIVVTPAVRVDLVRTAPDADRRCRRDRADRAARRHRDEPAIVRARGRSTSDVSVKASAGWYVRLHDAARAVRRSRHDPRLAGSVAGARPVGRCRRRLGACEAARDVRSHPRPKPTASRRARTTRSRWCRPRAMRCAPRTSPTR